MKTQPGDIVIAIVWSMIISAAIVMLTGPGPSLINKKPEIPVPEPEQAEVTYPVQWNSNTTGISHATNLYVTNITSGQLLVTNNSIYVYATNHIVSLNDRIVQELISEGFTPEDAREAYRIISEMAAGKREHISSDSPGTRIKEPNRRRFPAFEE